MWDSLRVVLVVGGCCLIASIFLIMVMMVFKSIVVGLVEPFDQSKAETFNRIQLHDFSREISKALKKGRKTLKKPTETNTWTNNQKQSSVFVIDFDEDLTCSGAEQFGCMVSYLLGIVEVDDQVFIRVRSPGGTVTGYSLAAEHLKRLYMNNTHVTASIDQVGASGGYWVACVANKIIAAPNADIGSIGVAVDFPNIYRLLRVIGVRFHSFHAGTRKRMISPFKKIDQEGTEWMKQKLERYHEMFKAHVKKYRPDVDIASVATGDSWPAEEALALKLVDQIGTGQEALWNLHSMGHHLYTVTYSKKHSPLETFVRASVQVIMETIYKQTDAF